MQNSPPRPSGPGQGPHASLGSSNQSGRSDGFAPIQVASLPGHLQTLEYQIPRTTGESTHVDTPNEKLDFELQVPLTEQNHVQFATYRADQLQVSEQGVPRSPAGDLYKTWLPLPLRPYFWIPMIVLLVLGAIGLEVALHFSNKNQGWPSRDSDVGVIALHYVYTIPPVAIAAIFVALWAWTDVEIKKIQPYVDLVHGDSPPHRSLLLDYTRQNNFLVWTQAASNRHYLVALASLMVILTLSFQPLAATLLVVKDTWFQEPDVTMKNLAAIGLNQNLQFNDLTSFLSGAGYAGASILYDLPLPPFIQPPYTIANFDIPVIPSNNGTAFVNTTAIKSQTGCQSVPVQMTQTAPGAWSNTASLDGCSFSWDVTNITNSLFGTNILNCAPAPPPQFNPVVFWFFNYIPAPARASATFCSPSISLWEVNVGVDIRTGNVTKVSETRPFSQTSQFSSFSANVTGAPLNGRAYNGIRFNLTDPDQFVLGRENATQLQLPASIYQAALKSPQDYVGTFNENGFSTLSDKVYGIYLALVAQQVYFLPDNEDITVQVKTFRNRVWLSDVSVHLLATAMLILAIFATIVHLFHVEDRRHLHLKHEPGTIASAVSIGADTGVGQVLAGRHAKDEIKEALRNRKFRIDPVTMKIIMEGELGYETAAIPASPLSGRRRSILGTLRGQRTSHVPATSKLDTPTFPKSPTVPDSHHEINEPTSPRRPTPLNLRSGMHSPTSPSVPSPSMPNSHSG